MMMYEDFLFDLKEHIRNTPEQVFGDAGLSQHSLGFIPEKHSGVWLRPKVFVWRCIKNSV